MSASARVTVTLPEPVVREIDRIEKNRSRFVLDAIRRELERRRREGFRLSIENPHPEATRMADAGFDEWAARLPVEDVSELVDLKAGKPVRWTPQRGWVEKKR